MLGQPESCGESPNGSERCAPENIGGGDLEDGAEIEIADRKVDSEANVSTDTVVAFQHLPREIVFLCEEKVRINSRYYGKLKVSQYRVVFEPYICEFHTNQVHAKRRSLIPGTPHMGLVEIPLQSLYRTYVVDETIRIETSDSRCFLFSFNREISWLESLHEQLLRWRTAFENEYLAYHLDKKIRIPDTKYSPEVELSKLIPMLKTLSVPLELGIFDQNESRYLCPSYPQKFIIPCRIIQHREEVEKIASFRSRGRLPVVRWIHRITGAVICRSSQPLSGLVQRRCKEDEDLISEYALCALKKHLLIVDARPAIAALGNALMGKGVENVKKYRNASLQYHNIENIHAVRKSYFKLTSEISRAKLVDAPNAFTHLKNAAGSWQKHIQKLLVATCKVSRAVAVDGMSVLVRCSDGFDRTPQIISLSKLILDSQYRTLMGMICLLKRS